MPVEKWTPAGPSPRSMGTSGTHFVAPPSPSISPAAIEAIEAKDKVREEAAAALDTARSCAAVACKVAREIHVDGSLAVPDRHRKAHDRSFQLVHAAIAPLEAARAKNAKAIGELRAILAGPKVELSDAQAFEVHTRLAGLPKAQLMSAISRSIAKGSDVIPAALFGPGPRSDRFLSESLLTDAELESVRTQWAMSRYPDEVARLRLLEKDDRALAIGAAALQAFQRGCSLPAMVIAEARDPAGAPGPRRPSGQPYGSAGTGGFAGLAARAAGHR
jgi:hypothetical protein